MLIAELIQRSKPRHRRMRLIKSSDPGMVCGEIPQRAAFRGHGGFSRRSETPGSAYYVKLGILAALLFGFAFACASAAIEIASL